MLKFFRVSVVAGLILPFAVSGCTQFPSSGPTANDLADSIEGANPLGIKIVDVTPTLLRVLKTGSLDQPNSAIPVALNRPVDEIGLGDTLAVTIYETGPGLFGGRPGGGIGSGYDVSANNTLLPRLVVDRSGAISIPYVGLVDVAGCTPYEAERKIARQLVNKVPDPAVQVTIMSNIVNTAWIAGEVRTPGRYPLSLAHEHLLDLVSASGGPTHPIYETEVRFARAGHLSVFPLSEVGLLSPQNVALESGDQVQLASTPRSFVVFGASGRVSDQPFNTADLDLAQGVARAGGPSELQADPTSVYLFRFETPEIGEKLGLAGDHAYPVMYHLDLLDAASYFEMRQIAMRDKDLIYVANARANQLQKVLNAISSIVTPVYLTKTLTN